MTDTTQTPALSEAAATVAPAAAALPSDILSRPNANVIPAPAAAPAAPVPAPGAAEVLYGEKPEAVAAAPAAPAAAAAPAPDVQDLPGPKPDGEVAPADAAAPLTVESYSTLVVPDTISIVEPILASAKETFLAEGVTPVAAQKLLDLYARASTEAAAAQAAAWASTQSQWTADIDALPEFQGDAQDATSPRARSAAMLGQALDEFGDPSVREFFRMTGDHPGVVKMILNMAKGLIEDSPLPPGRPAGERGNRAARTPGQILYGDTKTN